MKWLVIAVLALILAGGAGFALLYALDQPPAGIGPQGRLFQVHPGESVARIASRLEKEGIIRSRYLLRVIVRVRGTGAELKAGYYRAMPGTTTLEIHDLLVTGRQDEVRVTIPEGWTMRQIGGYLERLGIVTGREFLAAARSEELMASHHVKASSLEGYLFPDTYYFSRNMPPEIIVDEMVKNFFRRLAEIYPDYGKLSPERLNQYVILASIVEREYRVAEEAPYIASVFYNRLKYNIGLDSCATVVYVLTDLEGKPHPQVITKEDLKVDSPYNTYKWAGYPPGAISNPGAVALKAAFYPAKTDYYYFVLMDPAQGRHFFSKDLTEHNQAKRFYIKGVGRGR